MKIFNTIQRKVLSSILVYCILFWQIQATYAHSIGNFSKDPKAELAKHEAPEDQVSRFFISDTSPGNISIDPERAKQFSDYNSYLNKAEKELNHARILKTEGKLEVNKAGKHDYLLKQTDVWKSKEAREAQTAIYKARAVFLFWKAVEASKLGEIAQRTFNVKTLSSELKDASTAVDKATKSLKESNDPIDKTEDMTENLMKDNIGDPAVLKSLDDESYKKRDDYNKTMEKCLNGASNSIECAKSPTVTKAKNKWDTSRQAKSAYILSEYDKKIAEAKSKLKACKTISCRQSVQREVDKAIQDKKKYVSPGSGLGRAKATEKEMVPLMDAGDQMLEDSKEPVNQAIAKGEQLYNEQTKLNNLINNTSVSAIKLAKDSKEAALKMVGIKNDSFDLSKESMKDLLESIKGDSYAMDSLSQLATTSAATEHLVCVKLGDVECVSYYLFQAASAIYLSSQILQTTDFNKNIEDINNYDPNAKEEHDEQVKIVGKAAGIRFEAVDAAKIRLDNKETLLKMYKAVLAVAQQEMDTKNKRVAAAKKQVAKAKAWVKKAKRAIIISIAIAVVKQMLGITWDSLAIKFASCCGPYNPYCCKMAAVCKTIAANWWMQYAIAIALWAWNIADLIRAMKELSRAKAELAMAEIHTHLQCHAKGYNISQSIHKKAKSSPPFSLISSLTSVLNIAKAQPSGTMAGSLGMLDRTGMYNYYTEAKRTALHGNGHSTSTSSLSNITSNPQAAVKNMQALGMVAGFEIPIKRVKYLSTVSAMALVNVNGLQNNISNYAGAFQRQYKRLYDDMDQRLDVNVDGQPLGGKDFTSDITTTDFKTPETCYSDKTKCPKAKSSLFSMPRSDSKNVTLGIENTKKASKKGRFENDKRNSRIITTKSNEFAEKAATSLENSIKKFNKNFDKTMAQNLKTGTSLYMDAKNNTLRNFIAANPDATKKSALKKPAPPLSLPTLKSMALPTSMVNTSLNSTTEDDYTNDEEDFNNFEDTEMIGRNAKVKIKQFSIDNKRPTINTNRRETIFTIISNRYIESAYPRIKGN